MDWFLLGKRKNRSLHPAKQYEDSKSIGLVGSMGGINICSVGISSKFQIYVGGNSINAPHKQTKTRVTKTRKTKKNQGQNKSENKSGSEKEKVARNANPNDIYFPLGNYWCKCVDAARDRINWAPKPLGRVILCFNGLPGSSWVCASHLWRDVSRSCIPPRMATA